MTEGKTDDPEIQFLFGLGYGALLFASFALTVIFVVFCVCIKKNKEAVISDSNHNRSSNRKKSKPDLETPEDSRNARTTSHRKLPDLPNSQFDNGTCEAMTDSTEEQLEVNLPARTDSVRSSQDTSSELYAQVDIPPNKGNREELKNVEACAVQLLSLPVPSMDPMGEHEARPSTSKEHPYAKIKRKPENLYATVGRTDTQDTQDADETDTDNYDVVYNGRTQLVEPKTNEGVVSSQSASLLHIPSSVASTSNASLSTSISGDAPVPPPRGRRAQSMLLPDGTDNEAPLNVVAPPTPTLPPVHPDPHEAQMHFSGDSQDSKGYSSISVREPLANLQQSMMIARPEQIRVRADAHYSTVSDAEDSDDMYAAIADPSLLYNPNGSDTYAQIEPRNERVSVVVENHAEPVAASSRPHAQGHDVTSDNVSVVAPVPPSLASLRQLSSSRLNASTLSIASLTSALSSPKPEKRQANSPLPLPPTPTDDTSPLEEMYAKVFKKKGLAAAHSVNPSMLQHRGSVDFTALEPIKYDFSRRNSADGTWPITPLLAPVVSLDSPIEDVNYEVIRETRREVRAAFIERPVVPRPTVEGVQVAPSGMAAAKEVTETDCGYERIQTRNDSFNDPKYERIKPRFNLAANSSHGSADGDPNYERLRYRTVSESSEGYEELSVTNRNDPKYESVRFTQDSISPYESLHPRTSSAQSNRPMDKDDGGLIESAGTSSSAALPTLGALPLYAQVVKPKWKAKRQPEEQAALGEAGTIVEVKSADEGGANGSLSPLDDSVQSSNPTSTIITISQDGSAQVNYNYPKDGILGTPEQV